MTGDLPIDIQHRLARLERYERGMDLRRLIRMCGWETMGSFCQEAGVSHAALSMVLCGHERGSHGLMQKVCLALSVPGYETVPKLRKLTGIGNIPDPEGE